MPFLNTSTLESQIVGKRLTGLKCYHVNDGFYVSNSERLAIIDGGVELEFNDDKLAIGWNAENEHFDCNTESIAVLLEDLEYSEIPEQKLPFEATLFQNPIESIKLTWLSYQNLNDELEPEGPHQHFIEELQIYFEGGKTLQIVPVEYEIENKTATNFRHNEACELLIVQDRIIEMLTH